jgi:hypothetical protein
MGYRLMGRLHAAATQGLRREDGQGTVEYVALILLVAAALGGVIAVAKGAGDQGIADAVMKKLKDAIGSVKPN